MTAARNPESANRDRFHPLSHGAGQPFPVST
jgi:hypothetical protein